MDSPKKKTHYLGNLGEAYVILQLAKKGLYAMRVRGCNFDILCENGKRLEVKSAKPKIQPREIHPTHHFSFVETHSTYSEGGAYYAGYKRKQVFCDYYVLVAFTHDDITHDDIPEKYFIIPQEKLAYKAGLSIRPRSLGEWSRFMNNWDLLL